ncbi:hypothetical protein GCM10009750_01260 [Agromyces salentinus]|uniref:Uncharacterized protein n=1 Tax=Agromyces salentinus TaxID=269421 RepID=A0ABN2MGX0_9MICO
MFGPGVSANPSSTSAIPEAAANEIMNFPSRDQMGILIDAKSFRVCHELARAAAAYPTITLAACRRVDPLTGRSRMEEMP